MNFLKVVFICVLAFVSKAQGQDDLAGTFLSGNFIFIAREKVCTALIVLCFTLPIIRFSYCAFQRIYD